MRPRGPRREGLQRLAARADSARHECCADVTDTHPSLGGLQHNFNGCSHVAHSLILTSTELARLEALQLALLSPLDHPSVDDWRATVNFRARALLQGGAAAFALPPAPGRNLFYSEELSPSARATCEAMHFSDAGRQRAFALGMEVWNQTAIIAGDWNGYHRDPVVNEILKPNALMDAVGFDWPDGEPSRGDCGFLAVYRDRYGTELMGDKGLQLFRLLLPAFKAGVSAVLRMDQQRAAFASAMDDLGLALQVRALNGRVLHETPSLSRLLADDPESERLRLEMACVADAVLGLVGSHTKARAAELRETAYREVRTANARYRVGASVLPSGMVQHGGAALVTIERISPEPMSDSVLRARHRLTAREIQVARLMAEGHPNGEIARRLGVSLHTVRRHAERVREKLNVRRRVELAAKLRGE